MLYFTFSVVLDVKIAMRQVPAGSAHVTGKVRRSLRDVKKTGEANILDCATRGAAYSRAALSPIDSKTL